MRRTLLSGIVVSAFAITGGATSGPSADAAAARTDVGATQPAPATAAGPMHFPLLLVENRGQTDADVVAYARGRTTNAYFAKGGVTYSLHQGGKRWTLKADFVGANADVRTELRDAAPTLFNWFKGPKSQWKTGVRTFREIAYRDLWPGIDLVWTAGADELKYQFVVRPGADPSRIRFAWRGASGVAVDGAGALELTTPVAVLRDAAPVSFQDAGGRRVAVESAFAVDGSTSGFRVGAYDARLPLVIDPATILYAGYIGGEGTDVATGVSIDDIGGAYVSGYTNASEATFPRIAGPDSTQNGDYDAFVAKVTPGGAFLEYVGYVGGDGIDQATAIAVDSSRHAYIVGNTQSTLATFPAAVGPNLTHALQDGFIAKVSADGTSLAWCGYIGGSQNDVALGVAVDKNDNAYVTGVISGGEADFPVAVGPRTTFDTLADAFVVKVKADGTGFVYAGFIGGIGTADEGHAIAVDADGAAYVAGRSNGPDFPFTTGPGLVAKGSSDGFIAKVRPDGTGLVYAGLIGGSAYDTCNGVAVDSQKRAYVCGTTSSDETTFPVKVGPRLVIGNHLVNGHPGVPKDGFVARVKADGTGLEYCGYVGGSNDDTATGIALNDVDQAFVTGGSFSGLNPYEGSFPFIGGPGETRPPQGFEGAYITRVKTDGHGFVTSGFIGYHDPGYAIAVGDANNAYVVGLAKSTDFSVFPFPTLIGPDLTRNDSLINGDFASDAFIAKVAGPLTLAPVNSTLLPSKVTAVVNAKNAAKSTLTVTGAFNLGDAAANWASHATLDLGGLHFDIPALSSNNAGTKFKFAGGGLTLAITQSASGTSKAAFTATYVGDLTGLVGLDQVMKLKFANDSTTATSTVVLSGGKFKLSAPHGNFIDPCIYVANVAGKVVGDGKDTLSLTVGVAMDGTTPPEPPDLVFAFGDFSRTFTGDQFKRKGTKDVFTDATGDVTSMVVDYAKQTLTITGHKLTLGTFTQGANLVDIDVEFADEFHDVPVRVVVKGKTLTY
jgi:hypothetical protein